MTYRFGEFELCRERDELRRGPEPVALEPRVLEVLAYLVAHHDRVVSKHELLDQLWPAQAVSEAALTRTIREARRALAGPAAGEAWIRTVYGRGFRFVGPVAAAPAGAEVSAAPSAPGPERGAPALPSVAVLPFADLSPARDQAYFCDGLADELIDALGRIEGLRVASRSSSFLYRDRPVDARELGSRMNVATVLDGSVRRDGARLRIGVQLANVADNYNLWSAVFERPLRDVFAIQREIAENTARALRVVLSDRERLALRRVPRAEPAAYDYYLRGRQLAARPSCRSLEAARQMFRRAIELEPTYAPAQAGLADCSSFLHLYWGGDAADLVTAEQAGRRAVELAPDLAEAHAARGQVLALQGRGPEADAAFETALRLNPRLAKARYVYARLLWVTGRPAAAAGQLEAAERLGPVDCQLFLLAKAYDALGRVAEAAAARRRCVEQARRQLETDPSDVRALCLGGSALVGLGDGDAGREWIERARTVAPDDAVTLYYAAGAYARTGAREAALDALERAVRLGFRHARWAELDRDLDGLRRSARYRALVAGAPADRRHPGPRPSA